MCFTVVTLLSWCASIAILNQQKRAELIQNRPYISVISGSIENYEAHFKPKFSIKNENNTPTYSIEVSMYYSTKTKESKIGREIISAYLVPHQVWELSRDWSKEDVEKIVDSSGYHYVLEIKYFDYLRNRYLFTLELNTRLVNGSYHFIIRKQGEEPTLPQLK